MATSESPVEQHDREDASQQPTEPSLTRKPSLTREHRLNNLHACFDRYKSIHEEKQKVNAAAELQKQQAVLAAEANVHQAIAKVQADFDTLVRDKQREVNLQSQIAADAIREGEALKLASEQLTAVNKDLHKRMRNLEESVTDRDDQLQAAQSRIEQQHQRAYDTQSLLHKKETEVVEAQARLREVEGQIKHEQQDLGRLRADLEKQKHDTSVSNCIWLASLFLVVIVSVCLNFAMPTSSRDVAPQVLYPKCPSVPTPIRFCPKDGEPGLQMIQASTLAFTEKHTSFRMRWKGQCPPDRATACNIALASSALEIESAFVQCSSKSGLLSELTAHIVAPALKLAMDEGTESTWYDAIDSLTIAIDTSTDLSLCLNKIFRTSTKAEAALTDYIEKVQTEVADIAASIENPTWLQSLVPSWRDIQQSTLQSKESLMMQMMQLRDDLRLSPELMDLSEDVSAYHDYLLSLTEYDSLRSSHPEEDTSEHFLTHTQLLEGYVSTAEPLVPAIEGIPFEQWFLQL